VEDEKVPSSLNIPLPEVSKLSDIALHKGLAKLGDEFVNLVYSLAKSRVLQKATGWKVSTEILANALHSSQLRERLPSRLTAHQRANVVEAFLGYLWLSDRITLNEVVDVLVAELDPKVFTSRLAEKRAASKAFTTLLLKVKSRLPS